MPGVLLPSVRQSMKRPTEVEMNNGVRPEKRIRRVKHTIKHKQPLAVESLAGLQDEEVFQAQLRRAISLALAAQGYDEVHPSALESFRAEVDEFMLNFLKVVHHSMSTSRRETVIPQDYIAALKQFDISPSQLLRFLRISPAPSITQPTLSVSSATDFRINDYREILGESLDASKEPKKRKYIPDFLPKLPSKHTWQATAVLSARQDDAQMIRELATQEGIMAEQALRRLMASSSKAGDGRIAPGKRTSVNDRAAAAWDQALQIAQQLDQAELEKEQEDDMDIDDADLDFHPALRKQKKAHDSSFESGTAVNYDRRFWRVSGRGRT